MIDEKILVDKDFINNVKVTLRFIEKSTTDKRIVDKVRELVKYVDNYIHQDEISVDSLKHKIAYAMREAKGKNPDLESRLYILKQDVINNRVTFERASELFNEYMRLESYERNSF